MIILGIVLLLLGWLLGISILWTIGIILLVMAQSSTCWELWDAPSVAAVTIGSRPIALGRPRLDI